ncbi:MAG: ATP phosphoribosyltransferase regulatory subunit, partial [Burkholderiaceae bacterium]
GPHGSREPLQFGAEIYGHAGVEADLEVLLLALDCLGVAEVQSLSVDLTDARIVRTLLADAPCDAARLVSIQTAIAAKDSAELKAQTRDFPADKRSQLLGLLQLYGDVHVLDEAARVLPDSAPLRAALADLRWLAQHTADAARLTFDLADLRGYSYYSGARFTIYAQGARDALVRGGRYDEVGAVFGRNRPAVGFSLDVKALVEAVAGRGQHSAIRAPWGVEPALRAAIRELRAAGETVLCVLPGQGSESEAFECDRELVASDGGWSVRSLAAQDTA